MTNHKEKTQQQFDILKNITLKLIPTEYEYYSSNSSRKVEDDVFIVRLSDHGCT